MKNIYLLPTDKPSRLAILNSGKLNLGARFISSSNSKAQHIYITNNEEIKDVRQHLGEWQLEKGQILNKFPNYLTDLSECKLVIMTTDPDLIADGVQAIDDEFLEWFVKNPSCESIEVEDEGCQKWINPEELKPTKHKYIWISVYKIIIPQEEPKQSSNFYEDLKKHFENTPREKLLEEWEKSAESDKVGPTVEEFLNNSKQETLEEAARIWNESFDEYDEFVKKHNTNIQNSFIAGAQWQQERSYSKKDLISFAFFYFKEEFNSVFEDPKSIEEIFILWFEQFKKK
jgi:hypothetical protein